ncbi:hypothetical protein E5676_scaffold1704G00280 [Cucumis melo var. makuwa]|uniref:Uncharacterized protein n=1 Tax=Cucumis melo var. makuwa TaxID=1194695 RepID=A0A5A7VQ43_CUCMM|nr:hypothetical protein E6C27_scaffold179G00490 [Cucumis melo var. makuwa]TYK30684.1 hypothetical protein E5676_scaffold1704G00280 [Cucumis melo var. makuwa]
MIAVGSSRLFLAPAFISIVRRPLRFYQRPPSSIVKLTRADPRRGSRRSSTPSAAVASSATSSSRSHSHAVAYRVPFVEVREAKPRPSPQPESHAHPTEQPYRRPHSISRAALHAYTTDQFVLGVPLGSPKTSYVPPGSHVARVRERASSWAEAEVRARASWRVTRSDRGEP